MLERFEARGRVKFSPCYRFTSCTISPKTAKTLTDHYLMSALPPKADMAG
jgi:hypothetical protein